MNLEQFRPVYLRRLVAPLFRTLGFRFTRAVAARLAARVRGLHPPGARRAAGRLATALDVKDAA